MSGLVLVAGIDRQPEHCSDSGVESALPTGPSSLWQTKLNFNKERERPGLVCGSSQLSS